MEDNRFGRLVSVLVSPARTFRSIADRPTWLTAMLVVILCGLVALLLTMPKLDWEESISHRAEQKGRDLSAAEQEALVGIMEERGVGGMLLFAAVLPWIFYPLAAALFVGVFRLQGSELRFKTSLGVLSHALMPYLVATLISVPFLLAIDELTVDQLDRGAVIPNLAALAGEDASLAWITVLANFDVFALWSTVLLVIGYSVAAKVSRWRAAACVFAVWVLYVAGLLGLLALDRMLG